MMAAHVAIIVVRVIGRPLALRWRRFAWIHLVVATAVAAVFVLGADCPLTTWHKHFLSLAQRPVYRGGFVEHYLVEPVTGGGMTTGLKMIVLATWVLPTVVSYTLLWRRHNNNMTIPADASAVV